MKQTSPKSQATIRPPRRKKSRRDTDGTDLADKEDDIVLPAPAGRVFNLEMCDRHGGADGGLEVGSVYWHFGAS